MNQTGENNFNWKGGISRDNYHYKKIQRQRYPERINARNAVYHALRSGKIKKKPCFCGKTSVQAHHLNYDCPLEVIWLCPIHHRVLHSFIKD